MLWYILCRDTFNLGEGRFFLTEACAPLREAKAVRSKRATGDMRIQAGGLAIAKDFQALDVKVCRKKCQSSISLGRAGLELHPGLPVPFVDREGELVAVQPVADNFRRFHAGCLLADILERQLKMLEKRPVVLYLHRTDPQQHRAAAAAAASGNKGHQQQPRPVYKQAVAASVIITNCYIQAANSGSDHEMVVARWTIIYIVDLVIRMAITKVKGTHRSGDATNAWMQGCRDAGMQACRGCPTI